MNDTPSTSGGSYSIDVDTGKIIRTSGPVIEAPVIETEGFTPSPDITEVPQE